MTEENVDGMGNIVKDSRNWVKTPENTYLTSDTINTFNGHINTEHHYNVLKKV